MYIYIGVCVLCVFLIGLDSLAYKLFFENSPPPPLQNPGSAYVNSIIGSSQIHTNKRIVFANGSDIVHTK